MTRNSFPLSKPGIYEQRPKPPVRRSLVKARDCRQNGIIEEKEDVSPHLMAKIRIIQDEIGKIDSQLTKIKQAIRNYQNSSIFYLGRETELRAHWPHVTQIRKIDRMIRNLKKYEFERANDIEKQIIEQHSKTLMDLLIELIIKYHQGRVFNALSLSELGKIASQLAK